MKKILAFVFVLLLFITLQVVHISFNVDKYEAQIQSEIDEEMFSVLKFNNSLEAD